MARAQRNAGRNTQRGSGGSRMAKSGKGRDAFSTNQPVSTTSQPRAKGPAGKGGNWRAGVQHVGQVGRLFSNGNRNPAPPATQGSSVANMGDGMNANGHNVPRGMFANKDVARGILAGGRGSTPLAHTGTRTKRGKTNPAATVVGNIW